MDTVFLAQLVIPEQGFKVMATLSEGSKLKHHLFVGTDDLQAAIINSAEKQLNNIENKPSIYWAMGGFVNSSQERTAQNGQKYEGFARTKDNCGWLRSFWLDIDIGKKHHKNPNYLTYKEAITAVLGFIKATGLPTPYVVNSGAGLHVYWALDEDVSAQEWLPVARTLRNAIKKEGLNVDPARTVDVTSLLRAVDSYHCKGEPKLVKLFAQGSISSLASIADILKPYYLVSDTDVFGAFEVPSYIKNMRKVLNITSEFIADKVIANCRHIKWGIDAPEEISFGTWRGVLSVLRHCVNGREACHTYSAHGERYNEEKTDNALDLMEKQDLSPFTCDYFRDQDAKKCEGCPHKRNSPLHLGYPIEELPAPVERLVEEVEGLPTPTDNSLELVTPPPPYPYKRTQRGVMRVEKITSEDGDEDEAEEGRTEAVIYPYDIYPSMRTFTREVVGENPVNYSIWNIGTGSMGTREVVINMGDWFNMQKLRQILAAAGVYVTSSKQMDEVIFYMRAYQKLVQNDLTVSKEPDQFGWNKNDEFLIGTKLVTKLGLLPVIPAEKIIRLASCFEPKGTLAGYQQILTYFNRADQVGHQMVIMGCLAAPLMYFTNRPAMWFHLVGPSGAGKTTICEVGLAAWGNPKHLTLRAEDTGNSTFSRVSTMQNIPIIVDEVTKMEAKTLSQMVMMITAGREKNRLTQEAVERINHRYWQTLVFSSGNTSITETVQDYKLNNSAELARVLEFSLHESPYGLSWAEDNIVSPMHNNHGTLGLHWMFWVVNNMDYVRKYVHTVHAKLVNRFHLKPEERFWADGFAVIMAATELMHSLKLVPFAPEPLWDFVGSTIATARNEVVEARGAIDNILGNYINANIRNILVVGGPSGVSGNGKSPTYIPKRQPTGELKMRFNIEDLTVEISKSGFNKYCQEVGADRTTVLAALEKTNQLISKDVTADLGRGTSYRSARGRCIIVRVEDGEDIIYKIDEVLNKQENNDASNTN